MNTGTSVKTLTPLSTEAWDKSLSGIAQDMNGAPLNVHKLMAHNPDLLNAWWNFRNHAVNGGTLGPRNGELVILRVSLHLSAWYEWGSHVDRALKCGLSEAEIKSVSDRDLPGNWPESDATLLAAVDELATDKMLSSGMKTRLAKHFTAAQVLDLIAIHGMYMILGCMIRSWNPGLDKSVAESLQKSFTEAEFQRAAENFNAKS